MILSRDAIERAIQRGNIGIEPFDRTNLKSASYTFTLGERLLALKAVSILDAVEAPDYEEYVVGAGGYVLQPGSFVLGFTREKLTLNNRYGCLLSVRGSCAQMGLNVLLGSTFAEPDTDNVQNVEIRNVAGIPIKLRAGMKIIKGIFIPVAGD